MQVEQRHADAAAALWLDIVHKEREPEYACNSDAWHKLYAETFARFEASLPPSAPVDRDAAFTCAARKSVGANDPQDCNWPVCGCDPAANKVIEALEEAGLPIHTEGLLGAARECARLLDLERPRDGYRRDFECSQALERLRVQMRAIAAAPTPSVLAESTSNDCLLVAEAVREACAKVAERQFGDKPGTWFRAARVKIASAIRSLDLSGVGVG